MKLPSPGPLAIYISQMKSTAWKSLHRKWQAACLNNLAWGLLGSIFPQCLYVQPKMKGFMANVYRNQICYYSTIVISGRKKLNSEDGMKNKCLPAASLNSRSQWPVLTNNCPQFPEASHYNFLLSFIYRQSLYIYTHICKYIYSCFYMA